uniref:Receptor-like protein EIX2 n=1 Tax=Elaeis guineensis var. tenera TaxID=51953 RepID=A0A6I9QGT3_ELAGV|nr:receptor-like protein EIX2 [Elaeis guineensis]
MHLKYLDLSLNNFFGARIPKFIGSLVHLEYLNLSHAEFSGSIPLKLGNLSHLHFLDISWNGYYFYDSGWTSLRADSLHSLSKIPSLHSLDLCCVNLFNAANWLHEMNMLPSLLDLHLSGALPPLFGNLSAMKRTQNAEKPMLTDFNAYYTEGLVMTTKGIEIEYTSVLSFVMSIDLSRNNLSGIIPIALVNLHGLCFLNLSNNHFTGKILKNIGALTQLESLDLSVNNLSGMIPSTISSMYYLNHLNLSNNNLSGRILWGKRLQTFYDPSIYSGNPDLHGWPFPWCFNGDPSKSLFQNGGQEEEHRNGDESEMIWFHACSALGFVMGLLGFIYVLMIKRAIRIAYFHLIDMTYDYIYVQSAIRFAELSPSCPS